MNRLAHGLLFGAMGLLVLAACQGAPPQDEAPREATQEKAVAEETFESGDTGALTPGPEESTEEEEEPQDDSR